MFDINMVIYYTTSGVLHYVCCLQEALEFIVLELDTVISNLVFILFIY